MFPNCSQILALLLLAGVASAQEQHRTFTVPSPAQEPFKLEAPKPKTDRKVFFAGISLLAVSKTADAITTRQLLDRGGHENNPIFGPHPSPAKQSLINLGIFGAQATAFYLTEHNRHAWVRWTGRALIGHFIVEHSRLAACNAGIDTRSPRVQNCKPLF